MFPVLRLIDDPPIEQGAPVDLVFQTVAGWSVRSISTTASRSSAPVWKTTSAASCSACPWAQLVCSACVIFSIFDNELPSQWH
jgi:hypothetical protein